MKKFSTIGLQLFLAIFVSCNSTAADKTSEKNQLPSKNASSHSENAGIAVESDGIVGDWQLSLDTYDENGNMQLDEAERKKAFSNHYFYRFNADGSALVSPTGPQGAFKGYYKISTKKNHQLISVYLKEMSSKENPDGLESEHYIISVDKNELVLLEAHEERAFWIFKRS